VSAGESSPQDKRLYDAYLAEDMTVWKNYLDTLSALQNTSIPYLYGFCGYIVSTDKEAAKTYVARLRKQVETQRLTLPAGHYEMYMSAVLVFELRLHESFHPAKAMSLAKKATEIAPEDPIVLSYYGTSLFYAPRPFGSKREALSFFMKAQPLFDCPQYRYCWMREANEMYIQQCHDKLK